MFFKSFLLVFVLGIISLSIGDIGTALILVEIGKLCLAMTVVDYIFYSS